MVVGALTNSAKPGILYMEAIAKLRATTDRRWSCLPPPPSRNHERAASWLDSFRGPANTFTIGLNSSDPAAAIPRCRFVCAFVLRQPPSEIVVDRVTRGEAVGDLPKNCHLLPSTAILEPHNRSARCNCFHPSLLSRACQPRSARSLDSLKTIRWIRRPERRLSCTQRGRSY